MLYVVTLQFFFNTVKVSLKSLEDTKLRSLLQTQSYMRDLNKKIMNVKKHLWRTVMRKDQIIWRKRQKMCGRPRYEYRKLNT